MFHNKPGGMSDHTANKVNPYRGCSVASNR